MESIQGCINVKNSAKGNKTFENVDLDGAFGQFIERIASEMSLNQNGMIIRKGFPPKPIAITEENLAKSLKEIGIKNKESLIVEATAAEQPTISQPLAQPLIQELVQQSSSPMDSYKVTASDGGYIYRRIIEANDSCLFNSLGLAFSNSLKMSNDLRKRVANNIIQNPSQFDSAVLGKSPADYCKWIMQSTSWGGGIEMLILSQELKSEIVAVDIVNLRYDIFGQGQYKQRVYLIYSGIHYDLCVKNYDDQGCLDTEIRIFDSSDDLVLKDVMRLASLLNKQKQFTDVSSFSLQCGICFAGFKGQAEAQQHAEKTGHMNFHEIQH